PACVAKQPAVCARKHAHEKEYERDPAGLRPGSMKAAARGAARGFPAARSTGKPANCRCPRRKQKPEEAGPGGGCRTSVKDDRASAEAWRPWPACARYAARIRER